MPKHVETFHPNKDYKLAIVAFIPTLLLSKWKFVIHISNVKCTETRPSTPLFFI